MATILRGSKRQPDRQEGWYCSAPSDTHLGAQPLGQGANCCGAQRLPLHAAGQQLLQQASNLQLAAGLRHSLRAGTGQWEAWSVRGFWLLNKRLSIPSPSLSDWHLC